MFCALRWPCACPASDNVMNKKNGARAPTVAPIPHIALPPHTALPPLGLPRQPNS